MNSPKKLTLEEAVKKALNEKNEKIKILSLIECIRNYSNPFNFETEKLQRDGYDKSLDNLMKQKNKIKNIVKKHFKN